MIEGVKVKILKVHRDETDVEQADVKPGFLMEVLRDDDELFTKFGQSTFTITYPGTIKAFHYHKKQDDLWFVAAGRALVVLHDLRKDSPSWRETQTFECGAGDYKLILIPAGVAHGYKVISAEPVLMFYHTTESYDPQNPDEERLAYDDPAIGFDWGEG